MKSRNEIKELYNNIIQIAKNEAFYSYKKDNYLIYLVRNICFNNKKYDYYIIKIKENYKYICVYGVKKYKFLFWTYVKKDKIYEINKLIIISGFGNKINIYNLN